LKEKIVKVVFIEDVPDVAMAGQTREVADGYGRNYLLPKKLAVLANSAASNILEAQMKKVLVKRAQAAAEMAEIATKIEGVEITIKAKVGENERLYGSVTAADISTALNDSTGQVVDKRKIVLEEPIRQLGSHDVAVAFTHDITASIKVVVEAEKVVEEKEEKPERKPRAKKDVETEGIDEKAEELAAEIEETEVPLEEPAITKEEVEAKAEEPELAVEVTEAEVEKPEPEAVEEKPAKKTKAKKAKKTKEAEAKAEEPPVTAAEVEQKESEPGE
jgi:large subunit ribosomal protein L9